MAIWQVAVLVLAAVFVAASVPVAFQLFSTLRTAQAFLDHAGWRLDRTLEELADAARLVRQAGEDGRMENLGEFLDSLGELARTLRRTATASAVGSALAPAVAAAVRAWRAPEDAPDGPQRPSVEEP